MYPGAMAASMLQQKKHSGQFGDWRSLLKNRNVVWLWTGQLISQIGEGLSKFALLWIVYNMTGSALKMTTIGILQTIPPIVFGPFAGVVLDRVSKRRAMIIIDMARACLLTVIPLLYLWDMLSLSWLYGLVFLTAMFSMAFGPALSSAVPLIVKEEQLTQINALDQGTMAIGQLIGPVICGILIVTIGAQNVLFVNAGAFLVSALCKLPLRIPNIRKASSGHSPLGQALRDLKEGFNFIFVKHRLLLVLMAIASLFTLSSTGFVYLLPVLGKKVLQASAFQLGWLFASLSAGILVTTMWLFLTKPIDLYKRLWMLAGAAGLMGTAALLLGWTRSLLLTAAFIALIGVSSGLINPFVSASLQERVPKELLARVFSVFSTGYLAVAMIGMALFGWLADAFNPVVSVVTLGVVSFAAGGFTLAMLPWCDRYRRAESDQQGLAATGTG